MIHSLSTESQCGLAIPCHSFLSPSIFLLFLFFFATLCSLWDLGFLTGIELFSQAVEAQVLTSLKFCFPFCLSWAAFALAHVFLVYPFFLSCKEATAHMMLALFSCQVDKKGSSGFRLVC